MPPASAGACPNAGPSVRVRSPIAHRLSTVHDADLVVAMADGRAVEQGSHTDLLELDGLYARLVRTQSFA